MAGDDAALEFLFGRYLKPAYAYVARLIGPEDADDAVQEGFVKAWRNLKRFDQKRPFRPWLYRILHNAALDLLKKRRSSVFSDFDAQNDMPIEETIKDETPLSSELLTQASETEDLGEILAELPLKQRTVLLLYYDEDMTFAEIGLVLQESINTVKSRHHRAIQALRQKLPDRHQKTPPPRISP